MTPICVLDPGTCLGSSLERKKYVSKNCKGFPHCKILMNKSNLPKTLKQSNKGRETFPPNSTRILHTLGTLRPVVCQSQGLTKQEQHPRDPGVWQKSSRVSQEGSGVRLKTLPLSGALVIKARVRNGKFCLIVIIMVPSPAPGWWSLGKLEL